MAYNKKTIDKIVAQALSEIQIARTFKQGKVGNWQINEQMYYGKKRKSESSRANVQLARMQEFVHTLLSKIDNPLIFKFTKRKNAQTKRVDRLNALRSIDAEKDFWDLKDIVGKKQSIIYGRAIYNYYADSYLGYRSHLNPIDVYSFLIDPNCGGIEIETANYLGHLFELSKKTLKDGVKSGLYYKDETKRLLESGGNADQFTQEKVNTLQRTFDQNTNGGNQVPEPIKYKFWMWFTTYVEDGERYKLIMDNSGNCIQCVPLTEIFAPTKDVPLGAWPYWTWAAFPDLTEFWTPSYCDYAREIYMAQDVSINQMLDNAEAINKPMRLVNTSAIENLAELKYRRDGIIKTKGDYDINKAYQTLAPPSIDTPIKVYDLLEAINSKAMGVTDGTAGVADESGKVGIYEGNQAAAADRFGLLNKSYTFGYKRFAKLWEQGVQEHLIKKVAVDILGPDGVEIEEVRRSDIFKKGDEFNVSVEASNAQFLASQQDKQARSAFLQAQANNPDVNKKKSFEFQARDYGFTDDQIRELLDVYYGDSELMGEADRDLESLLDGEEIKPNANANNAYKQRQVDWLKDHQEDINDKQFAMIASYIETLDPIIINNEVRAIQQDKMAMLKSGVLGGGHPQATVESGNQELINEPTTMSAPNQ